jgi:hypothetical protein
MSEMTRRRPETEGRRGSRIDTDEGTPHQLSRPFFEGDSWRDLCRDQ